MNAKYNKKMEDIILNRYESSSSNQLQTANGIFKDFKGMFSNEALKGMSARRIMSKYQTLKSKKAPSHKWPEAKKTTLKDTMFEAMKRSDDMTITIKGTEITVVFK